MIGTGHQWLSNFVQVFGFLLGLHVLRICKWTWEGLVFKIMFAVCQINIINLHESTLVLIQSASKFEVKKKTGRILLLVCEDLMLS